MRWRMTVEFRNEFEWRKAIYEALATQINVSIVDDISKTGKAACTTGNNILEIDGSAATDAKAQHSIAMSFTATAGISAGVVSFEQSIDNINWAPLQAFDVANANSPPVSGWTIVANTTKIFAAPVNTRYVRARISTTVVGGTVQAFSNLSELPFAFTSYAVNINANAAINIAQVGATNVVTAGVSGLIAVGGNAGAGVADTGNPVKVGGKYNSVLPSYTSGNRGDLQQDKNGKIHVVHSLTPDYCGYTAYNLNAAATTNPVSIKTMPGNISEITAFNAAAYPVYLRIYNKATAPTVGTDISYRTIMIPAGTEKTISFPNGAYFSAGIAIALTKGVAATDATAVAAGDVQLTIQYI
jgi:hypothetical protein